MHGKIENNNKSIEYTSYDEERRALQIIRIKIPNT